MLRTLKLTNFRSLGRDVDLSLGPLSVLVGRNGSGKSNILRALTFVRDAMRLGLPGAVTHSNGIDAVRRHSKGHPHNVRIDLELTIEGRAARYAFELTGDSTEEYRVKSELASISHEGAETVFEVRDGVFYGPDNLRPSLDAQSLALTALGGDTRLRPLWDELANLMVYSINPSELRKPQKFSAESPMSTEGENWVSILHTQAEAAWKQDLVAALAKLTGDVDDVKVTKVASFLVAEFHHRSDGKAKKWFPAERESDGTLRVAGILTALLQQPSLPMIGIEEPEQTIHPGALPILYDYVREASDRSQIILTTHSPTLLDFIDVEECRVFVVGRGPDGTTVTPLAPSQKRAVEENLLSLGDLIQSGDLQLDLPWGDAG
jgi:predicted ATPase